MEHQLDNLEMTPDKILCKKVHILYDKTHPLRVELDSLKSCRSTSRLRAPSVKKKQT